MNEQNTLMERMSFERNSGWIAMTLGFVAFLFWQMIKWIFTLLSWYSVVFLRYRFGERAFTPFWLFIGWLFTMMLSNDIFNIGGALEIVDAASITPFYKHMTAWLILSIAHLLHLRFRNRVLNEEWHSKSKGISYLYLLAEKIGIANWQLKWNGYLLFTIRHHTFWKYIEPLFIIMIGINVYAFGCYFYGAFLVVSGMCIWGASQLDYMDFRYKVLNIKDGKIEGDFLKNLPQKGTVKEKSLQEHKGIDDYGAIHSREESLEISGIVNPNLATRILSEAELNPV